MKIIENIIAGSLVKQEFPYLILLPDSYQNSKKYYPVLYLLHGLFGSYKNWLELTRLRSYTRSTEFIIVLPEAGNSWYSDGETNTGEKFESFFINEFFPQIEMSYRIIRQKKSRAICGLSMGGYGALKFALKYPDLFCFSGSMSGVFDAAQLNNKNLGFDWENLGPSINRVFGNNGSIARKNNDLFELVKRVDNKDIYFLPKIYISCGKSDGFLETNQKFVKLLANKGVNFEYFEKTGKHDWVFWDKELMEILRIVSHIFKLNND